MWKCNWTFHISIKRLHYALVVTYQPLCVPASTSPQRQTTITLTKWNICYCVLHYLSWRGRGWHCLASCKWYITGTGGECGTPIGSFSLAPHTCTDFNWCVISLHAVYNMWKYENNINNFASPFVWHRYVDVWTMRTRNTCDDGSNRYRTIEQNKIP